jgi:hypothetical protein
MYINIYIHTWTIYIYTQIYVYIYNMSHIYIYIYIEMKYIYVYIKIYIYICVTALTDAWWVFSWNVGRTLRLNWGRRSRTQDILKLRESNDPLVTGSKQAWILLNVQHVCKKKRRAYIHYTYISNTIGSLKSFTFAGVYIYIYVFSSSFFYLCIYLLTKWTNKWF